jgi:hypothetical protein
MNKRLVVAIAAGFVSSALVLGDGVAAGDAVLMVPGTAPPDGPAKRFYHFKPEWVPAIAGKYYINPGVTNNPGDPGVAPEIVTYPAANPTSASSSMTVGQSVAAGANNLDAAIRSTNGPMTVVGLSQGAEVIDEEQLRLANDPNAPPPSQITFIKVSDPAIVLRRLFQAGTYLPVFDYTVPPPVESQYNTVYVASEYDFVGDPPDRWGNLLAVLNSGIGLQHTMVAFSDPASVPPQNITVTTNSRGATTTTYLVPQDELPLTTQLRDWGVPNPVADRLDQVMRPMVDRAYDRNQSPSDVTNRTPLTTQITNQIRTAGAAPLTGPLPVTGLPVTGLPVTGPLPLTAAAGALPVAPPEAVIPKPGTPPNAKEVLNQLKDLLPKGKR